MRPRIGRTAHIPFCVLNDLNPFSVGSYYVTRPLNSLDAELIYDFVQDLLVVVPQTHWRQPPESDHISIL